VINGDDIMPRFYKKTALGFMSEAEDPDDPEVAEIRMTVDEFQRFREQIARFRKEAEVARSDAARQEVDARRRIDRELTDHKRKVDAQADSIFAEARREVEVCELVIESQKEQLEKVKAELRNEKSLNTNLVRIMRERANQARGIRPKKNHDGYIVLGSRQWTEKYMEEVWDSEEHAEKYGNGKYRSHAIKQGYLRFEKKMVNTWRSIIQTPYSASLPVEPVRARVKKEIGKVSADIGVEYHIDEANKDNCHDWQIPDYEECANMLYRAQYSANYKTGFWELTIYTTKSLRVPENRCPVKQERTQRQKNC
jgi:hypothetical protein